jgi:hypothetical protein
MGSSEGVAHPTFCQDIVRVSTISFQFVAQAVDVHLQQVALPQVRYPQTSSNN